jgi:hypothetical protein
MSRKVVIGLASGLAIGAWIGGVALYGTATAQGTAASTGLYQIQVASGLASPGTTAIWRVNTATGALDLCTFSNVVLSGGGHISCQGNPGPR